MSPQRPTPSLTFTRCHCGIEYKVVNHVEVGFMATFQMGERVRIVAVSSDYFGETGIIS
jgi:hypothetical protein